jgi:ferredoxin
MNDKKTKILLCNCAKTMSVDGAAIGTALGDNALVVHTQLCRTDIAAYETALDGDEPLLVACTQEAPLFSEVAAEAQAGGNIDFVNIRERAGWCESGPATAKMAALLADRLHVAAPARLKTVESDGMCLIYGAGQTALDAARRLSGRLSVTLILNDANGVLLPPVLDFAIYRGRLSSVSGSLGNFDVVIDAYAPVLPSSRGTAEFLMPRDDAKSRCSVIVDFSSDPAPVTGWSKRDGYLKADPGDPAAVARLLFEASDLVGTFEKPIYVTYDADICAHSRSGITGCSNCLDACPAGAITSAGDVIAIDDGICGGCGSCASHCPTGAVSYAYPERGDLVHRLQKMLSVYHKAGGAQPVVFLHDESEGAEIINIMARAGRGLPPNVLPVGLHASGMPGHDVFAAALVAGAEQIVVLNDPNRGDDSTAIETEATFLNQLLAGLGDNGRPRVRVLAERDPETVESFLYDLAPASPITTATFEPVGGKRDIARSALQLLRDSIEGAPEIVPLADGSPYGRIVIETQGCTMCLSCISACPVGALADNPDRPEVRFIEAACVQCGLCVTTCPEKVITLSPRLNFSPAAMQPETLYAEEPFECVKCGKPFGSRSTIERISNQLAGQHSMFQTDEKAQLIQMCQDCRIEVQADMPDSPFALGDRPKIRTTEDYLEARKQGLSVDDFLSKD